MKTHLKAVVKNVIVNEKEKLVTVIYKWNYTPFNICFTSKGHAKCHSSDTFDPEFGTKLAEDRASYRAYMKMYKLLNQLIDSTYVQLKGQLKAADNFMYKANKLANKINERK